MLIDSPRLSEGDRTRWAALSRYDRILGAAIPQWKIDRALASIRDWWTGEGVASVSWGKDSVCMAHLVTLTGLSIPLVWVRTPGFDMPECEQVRDYFLTAHPDARYEERVSIAREPRRGEPGFDALQTDPTYRRPNRMKQAIPERYISGIRGAESKIRRISVAHRGLVTPNTCRPIGRWSGTDVFAYLEREGLPVHPVYAMSYGGVLDRQWLRVGPLCSSLHGTGYGAFSSSDPYQWEDDYYGGYIAEALRQRQSWRDTGDPRGGDFT